MVVSHVKLFAESQQDEAAASVRVVAAHKKAVLEVLARASTFTTADELVTAIALGVLAAEDHTETRYCVATRTPHGDIDIYGPYLNPGAAQRAVDQGWCAYTAGTRGMILPLVTSPKATKRKMPTTKKAPARTKRARS